MKVESTNEADPTLGLARPDQTFDHTFQALEQLRVSVDEVLAAGQLRERPERRQEADRRKCRLCHNERLLDDAQNDAVACS